MSSTRSGGKVRLDGAEYDTDVLVVLLARDEKCDEGVVLDAMVLNLGICLT